MAYFEDDFVRPDSPDVGNGWYEKKPGCWEILNNSLRGFDIGDFNYNEYILRPEGEGFLNGAASVQFKWIGTPGAVPSVFLRVDDAGLNSYSVILDISGSGLIINRCRGGIKDSLHFQQFSGYILEGVTYELSFSAYNVQNGVILKTSLYNLSQGLLMLETWCFDNAMAGVMNGGRQGFCITGSGYLFFNYFAASPDQNWYSKPFILYDNILNHPGAVLEATTTEAGYNVENVRDWRPYTLWKGTGTGTQYITVDCLSAKTVNVIALMGHNFNSIGAEISVEASQDNFQNDIRVVFPVFKPSNDKAVLLPMPFGDIYSARYWRLKIGLQNSPPFTGIFFLGSLMEFSESISDDGKWDPKEHKIMSVSERSQGGNLLGTAVSHKKLTLHPVWDYVASQYFDTIFMNFYENHAALLKPFFFAWNYAERPNDINLVSLPEGFSGSFPYQNGFRQINLELEGILE